MLLLPCDTAPGMILLAFCIDVSPEVGPQASEKNGTRYASITVSLQPTSPARTNKTDQLSRTECAQVKQGRRKGLRTGVHESLTTCSSRNRRPLERYMSEILPSSR